MKRLPAMTDRTDPRSVAGRHADGSGDNDADPAVGDARPLSASTRCARRWPVDDRRRSGTPLFLRQPLARSGHGCTRPA